MSFSRVHRRTAVLAALLALTMIASAPQAIAVQPTAPEPGSELADIDPAVLDQVTGASTSATGDDPVSYWVLLDEAADLTGAEDIDDWAERGEFVVDRLQETAEQSQGEVTELLADAGVEHDNFWIANSVKVTGGGQDLLMDVAAVSEVTAIEADAELELIDPVESTGTSLTSTGAEVEWGIASINADSAWEDFDIRGEDVVVGIIDTG